MLAPRPNLMSGRLSPTDPEKLWRLTSRSVCFGFIKAQINVRDHCLKNIGPTSIIHEYIFVGLATDEIQSRLEFWLDKSGDGCATGHSEAKLIFFVLTIRRSAVKTPTLTNGAKLLLLCLTLLPWNAEATEAQAAIHPQNAAPVIAGNTLIFSAPPRGALAKETENYQPVADFLTQSHWQEGRLSTLERLAELRQGHDPGEIRSSCSTARTLTAGAWKT